MVSAKLDIIDVLWEPRQTKRTAYSDCIEEIFQKQCVRWVLMDE